MVQKTDAWLKPILDLVATQGGRGGALLAFPEYRPDLAKAIAHGVGIRFYDFRAETMAEKGFQAGAMGLDELDTVLAQLAAEGGALVLNVEALLSTKSSEERRAWMQGFLRHDWPGLLLVPLALYGQDAPVGNERVLYLEPEDLPAQGLINRLAALIISPPTTPPVIPAGCRHPAPWRVALGYSCGGRCTRPFSRRGCRRPACPPGYWVPASCREDGLR